MEPSTYHHGDLKACLIALAHSHVAEKGPEAVSLRDISRAAGVSHSAAYRHFPTKEALLVTVAAQGFEALAGECQAAASPHAGDALAQLRACGLAYVRFGRGNPRLLALMFGQAGQGPALAVGEDTPLAHSGAALLDVLLGVVQAGQASGAIVAHDARTVAWSCWALVHGCACLAPAPQAAPDAGAERALQERIHWSIDAMVRGVQAPQGNRP